MGKVIFTEKSLEAKTAADAVGRVLSGQADMQWCADNGQLTVRGVWRRDCDVLIKKPAALWRKMCGGYQPIEGRDYDFQAEGVMSRPDVGCYGGDDDTDESDDINEDESVTPPAADVTDTSWRAEVVSEAISEDALEAWAEAELWGMARAEAAAAAWRLVTNATDAPDDLLVKWNCQHRASVNRVSNKLRRRWSIKHGARPYVPAYDLAPDIVVFEGEIYRVEIPF